MQKLIIASFIALYSICAIAEDDRKVAVFDPAGNAESAIKEIVREEISSMIVNAGGYTVVERQLIDRVLAESRFQQGGLVDDAQAVEMGRMLGANLALVTSITLLGANYHISCKLIDVQTARIERQRTSQTQRGTSDMIEVVQRILREMFPNAPQQTVVTPRQTEERTRAVTVTRIQPTQTTINPDIPLIRIINSGVSNGFYQFDRDMNQADFRRFLRYGETVINKHGWATYSRGTKLNYSDVRTIIANTGAEALLHYQSGNYMEAIALHNSRLNRNDITQMLYEYRYEIGKKKKRAGNAWLWTGITLTAAGFPLYFATPKEVIRSHNTTFINNKWNHNLGIVCWSTGSFSMIVGVIIRANGIDLMYKPSILRHSDGRSSNVDIDIRGNSVNVRRRF